MWLPSFLENTINNRFGSKRGLLKTIQYGAMYKLGFFKRYSIENIGFKPERYVFVCAGNICRSPLAEAVARSLGVKTASFGLDTRGGDSADPRAIAFAEQEGICLTEHLTSTAAGFQPLAGDVIVAMEPKHLALYKETKLVPPIVLLGMVEGKPYIHDPFSCNDTFFNRCERLVASFTKKMVEHG